MNNFVIFSLIFIMYARPITERMDILKVQVLIEKWVVK